MQNEWFRDFFDGLAVDFWMAVAPRAGEDIAFLQTIFGDGGEILDVACGAGRHTLPLARAGYRMTGVDLSPAFLDRARQSAPEIEWQQRDMRDLPWRDRFDGALCFGNSFGYLGRDGSRDSIAAIARTLKHGAPFVLETGASAESLLPSLHQRRWMDAGDILFLSSSSYDAAQSRLDVEYTFIRGERRERKIASTSIFTVAEMREMFERAGFVVEGLYASTQRDPFTLGAPRMILVARKPRASGTVES